MSKALYRRREALAIDPKTASYRNSLGMVLGGRDRMAEAEEAFRGAVGRDQTNAEYAYNLGLAILRQGRPPALEKTPRDPCAPGRRDSEGGGR